VTEHPLANYPRLPPRGEDLPYDDGEPMESGRHRDQMNLLINTLADSRDDPSELFVGGNMFVYFSETQAKRNDFRGPDVFVVIGRPQQDVKSWVAWEQEGRLPDVVIELISPKTEKVDREVKHQIYRDVWKVRRYYLFDPWTLELNGFALDDGEFVPIAPNAEGRLECAPLGLELGVRDTEILQTRIPALRWFDARGHVLPTGQEQAAQAAANLRRTEALVHEVESRAEEAEARAAEAEARAEALARRLAELEAGRSK